MVLIYQQYFYSQPHLVRHQLKVSQPSNSLIQVPDQQEAPCVKLVVQLYSRSIQPLITVGYRNEIQSTLYYLSRWKNGVPRGKPLQRFLVQKSVKQFNHGRIVIMTCVRFQLPLQCKLSYRASKRTNVSPALLGGKSSVTFGPLTAGCEPSKKVLFMVHGTA